MNLKYIRRKIVICMLAFLVIAIGIETHILRYVNKMQVDKTSQILENQIEDILITNGDREKNTIEGLKSEYIERANTVAYILEHNETALDDIVELSKIAEMMGIDEIHLFDSNGVLYGGTVPKYYGITFDTGEQVSFFKPMLNDKTLSMCQDITPNTVEGKSMMYAITWSRTGDYMVQVGIEPVRLLKELQDNSISKVVSDMPIYDGISIYVADINTGEVIGATDSSSIGKTVYEIDVLKEDEDIQTIERNAIRKGNFDEFGYFGRYGDYVIAVIHSTKANREGFVVAIIIEIIWLLVAGSIIIYTLLKLANANKRINDQMTILSSISDIYHSMHLINMHDYSIEKIESNDLMDRVVEGGENASDMLNQIVHLTIEDEYMDAAESFVDLTTLCDRLKNRNFISMDAVDKRVGWLRISFITVEADENKVPTKVIIATQVIDEDKKREEELAIKANRDELTGLYNRRAYEDDLLNYPDVPVETDFVYAAIDINGLKVVNDGMGHAAGDELIQGAARCMKMTLGNYGRVYRTGGDEFVSMFFADEKHLQAVIKDLDRATLEWSGEFVDSLSLSVGYVTKREYPTETVAEMAKIADEKMYKAKAEHYAKKGVDRRGQAAAHTALCNLYTKILKINITKDTYSIVNMDISEQSKEKGFSYKISEWLSGFGKAGQVHKDDLDDYLRKTDLEYLKQYFKSNKTSISIHYRRKYEEKFKQVVMEMIPADDYSEDNQSLFLYVKVVDK